MVDQIVSQRVLNRTLLQRQHLLERSDLEPLEMIDHLVGLQAQDLLPPYLSLWSRIRDFDPAALSLTLETRATVRITVMRGTIHWMTMTDALTIRPLFQDWMTGLIKATDWGRRFPPEAYGEAARMARQLVAERAMAPKELGEAMRQRFPDHAPSQLVNIAKTLLPLVQIPPRGLWRQPGGQRYVHIADWRAEGGARVIEPDLKELVRRYLRAFGPASPADFTTWSSLKGARAVFDSINDELVRYRTESGRELFDIDGLPLADPDLPAPVRLFGTYDNVYLSHADRSRILDQANKARWMGPNGGVASPIFIDGRFEGLWKPGDPSYEIQLFRRLTRSEQADLDAELDAARAFLG